MNDFYIGYWKETFFHVHPIGKITCHGEFLAKICFEMSRLTHETYVFITKQEYNEYGLSNRLYFSCGCRCGMSYQWA